MFRTFFFREIITNLTRPMVWVFLLVLTIITTIGVLSANITLGGSVGGVMKNAPHVISIYSGTLTIFALMIAASYFNNAALKDYQANFKEILFSTPVKKRKYFFGRFFGALVLSTIPLLGVFLGFLLASSIGLESGLISSNRIGQFHFSYFLNNYFLFILPNMFVSGAFIFAMANTWKRTIVSFIAVIVIVMTYSISGTLLSDLDNEFIAAISDIFGIRAYEVDSKYYTILEKNNNGASFTGFLLINRAIWTFIGLVILIISYLRFSFKEDGTKVKKNRATLEILSTNEIFEVPRIENRYNLTTTKNQFLSFFSVNFYSILKSTTYKILLLLGGVILVMTFLNGFEYYGLQSYPVTYKTTDFVRGISTVLLFIIIVFFSGEVVWRDRANGLNEVIDSTPHNSFISLSAKTVSLIALIVLFQAFFILISIGFQLLSGYYNIELGLYLKDFLFGSLPRIIIWSCILISIQVILNKKYLAYFVSVILLLLFETLMVAFNIEAEMINLGNPPLYIYSDMNGFGPEIKALHWFNIYWMFFGLLFLFLSAPIWIRGKSSGIRNRIKSAKNYVTSSYVISLSAITLLFVSTGGVIYYNTMILNSYETSDVTRQMQVSYEKKYKSYSESPQPKIVKALYNIDIYPEERKIASKTFLTLMNKTDRRIDSLYFTTLGHLEETELGIRLKLSKWNISLTVPNSDLVFDDDYLKFQTYKLKTPLQPSETIEIIVESAYITEGFENSVSDVNITKNSTFIDNTVLLPILGYNHNIELIDDHIRNEYGLKPKQFAPKLSTKNKADLSHNYITEKQSDWATIETIISTSKDQIAIAPGSLLKEWEENNRRYFRYNVDHVSKNFINFMSARYKVARKKWNGIDIEIYHHKTHVYNIEKMISAVQKALMYYTEKFGAYPHKQARIVEFPRYDLFAQAFPGTMPYSEGLGFILNLEGESDNNIIDAVIAHEIGHQWWGQQVIGANVQGASMLSESFAEYSALMVMKSSLDDQNRMKQFLKYNFDRYFKGRSDETRNEIPLYKVENQSYIHYSKGSLVLYSLQEYIGEEKVNTTLKNFLEDYKYKEPPYPTTLDFLKYLEPEVPDSLKYIITDWFKEVTLYDYQLNTASYKKLKNGQYELSLVIEAHKTKMDSLGKVTEVRLSDWVDVGIYSDTEEKSMLYSERVFFKDRFIYLTFDLDSVPKKVVVDPKRLSLERETLNNRLTPSQRK